MTRKEEIEQAALRYSDVYESMQSFYEGAEWADQNPSEAALAMYLGKKGWPLSTYGIPTYEEAAKTIEEYYQYKRKQWLEKACEWFEQNLHMYNTAECFGDRQKFIEDFKKTMKE